MAHNPTDRPSFVAVPKAQTIGKAGQLIQTKEDPTGWPIVGGVQTKDGWAYCNGSTYDENIFTDLFGRGDAQLYSG